MAKSLPNLSRMLRDLIDAFWMEASCGRLKSGEIYKCHEIKNTREQQMCPACEAFVSLKNSWRLLFEGDGHGKRFTDPTPQRFQ